MKKILVCPDIHFCQYYSIIDQRGKKYSAKLENCIDSVNWVMQTALKENCSSIFYLGDFFDKSVLNAEEITALSDIDFNIELNQFIIVGNHEAKTADNAFNTSNSLQKVNVFDKYQLLEDDTTAIHLIPYIYDCPEDLLEIIKPVYGKKNLVLSHNDLNGVNYGNYISKNGFSLESIEKNCDLFINGHIHNNSWVTKKILNLGILTGKNFNEDFRKYTHQVAVVDLDTFNVKLIENPFALNFAKFDSLASCDELKHCIESTDKKNLVFYIKCQQDIQPEVKTLLENYKLTKKVFTYKIITERKYTANPSNNESKKLNKINPYKDLRESVLRYVDNSEYTRSELDIICS